MNEKTAQALKMLTGDDENLFKELSEKLDSVNREAATMISREKTDEAKTPEPVQVRALTPEDIGLIVNSQEFTDRVKAIFTELMPMTQEEKVDAPKVETTERTGDGSILAAIAKLEEKVNDLTQNREAAVSDVLKDLPAKVATQQIVRPRATRLPESINRRANLAEIANETLNKMGANS